jgi:hypothetical protein
MTDQQQQQGKPLWEVMHEASAATPLLFNGTGGGWYYTRRCYAAELRAIAGALVPEREFPGGDDIQRGMWLAQSRIRDRLLDEADRAERGER